MRVQYVDRYGQANPTRGLDAVSNPTTSFRAPQKLLDDFRALCAEHGLTPSEGIVRLIEACVKGLIPMPTRELAVEDRLLVEGGQS